MLSEIYSWLITRFARYARLNPQQIAIIKRDDVALSFWMLLSSWLFAVAVTICVSIRM